MLRIAALSTLSIFITGCASTVDFRQYSLPPGKPIADIELMALDKYRNTDTIELFVLSRASCSENPVLAKVTWVGSKGLFGKDSFYKSTTALPANVRINLQLSNRSSSGYVTTHCNAGGSFVLDNQKRYALKMNNWSTKDSEWSGFGCGFNVFEVDPSGNEVARIKPDNFELPQCDAK